MSSQSSISRGDFIQLSLLGMAGIALPTFSLAQDKQERPPAINLEIVKEFVGVSHSNLDRVKEMLENDPQLHVSFDWGGGDSNQVLKLPGT